MAFQQIILEGHLGRDPEMRYAPSGDAVTNFSMAVNEVYNNKAGEKIENTYWFRVTVWGKMAENCAEYLHKGSEVLVVGTIQGDPKTGGPRIYKKNDGFAGASFEVKAQTVRFVGGKKAAGDDGESGDGGLQVAGDDAGTDEMPF
jgi:single-strand DNA-binding protein